MACRGSTARTLFTAATPRRTASLAQTLQPRCSLSKSRPGAQCQQRCMASKPPPQSRFKTVEQAKARNRMGPVSIWSGLFFLACGGGMMWYFQHEKERIARQRVREASRGVGKPRIGGDFVLVDQDGKEFTSEDIKGKFSLLYFGFSNCPDICPDELDKMARMIDLVKDKRGNVLKPIFITCDPNRDTPPVVKTYLSEFHPDLIGLTGTWEQVKAMCKAYRVYFSTPPHVQPGQDYLVDHSIYFYLMDPEGVFIEVIGRQHTASQGAKIITDHIDLKFGRTVSEESWKDKIPTSMESLAKAA